MLRNANGTAHGSSLESVAHDSRVPDPDIKPIGSPHSQGCYLQHLTRINCTQQLHALLCKSTGEEVVRTLVQTN